MNIFSALKAITRIAQVTNDLAEEVKQIREMMKGRGINPKDVPIVDAKMAEMEQKLRIIGSNPDNPIPF